MPPVGEWWLPFLTAAFAAIGAFVANRTELRFVWRDIRRLARRVRHLEKLGTPHRRWDDDEDDD